MGYDRKKVISWSMYDWANSSYATTVMAGFFPVFFKEFWSAGADVSVSTFHLGLANSLSGIIVAVLSPVLGAIADKGSAKKRFLFYFTALGIVTTGALYFIGKGRWEMAVALFVLSSIGFSGGNIFYDSLLVDVAEENKLDYVSSFGFALGYLGGGLLFALNIFMTLSPKTFGLENASEGVRASFASVALWWGVFSIPILMFVEERRSWSRLVGMEAVRAGFGQLRATFREVRELRVVFLFLIGYWFYIDGLNTVISMAVDYGLSIGFQAKSLLLALLITQFVGFPAAIAFGKLGEKFGAKTGIFIGIAVYLGVTLYSYFMKSEKEFYVLAIVIGLVQGGVQSLSRSLYARMIPENKAAEFFGFFNMLGKFATVLGPLLMGVASLVTKNPRFSIFSISILFVIGGVFLYFVNEAEGHELAEELEKIG